MKRVTALRAKTHLLEYLTDVEYSGEEIIIQKRGVDVAALIPFGEFKRRRSTLLKKRILRGLRDVRAAYQENAGDPRRSLKEGMTEGRKGWFRI